MYKDAESKKREAEAFVKEAQYRAEAKTAKAEAERVEAEKIAELVSPANARKAETLVFALLLQLPLSPHSLPYHKRSKHKQRPNR